MPFLTSNQAVEDVTKVYDTITSLYECLLSFLRRLRIYIGVPLTGAMVSSLGEVMAQVLLVFAHSTKAIEAGQIGE